MPAAHRTDKSPKKDGKKAIRKKVTVKIPNSHGPIRRKTRSEGDCAMEMEQRSRSTSAPSTSTAAAANPTQQSNAEEVLAKLEGLKLALKPNRPLPPKFLHKRVDKKERKQREPTPFPR